MREIQRITLVAAIAAALGGIDASAAATSLDVAQPIPVDAASGLQTYIVRFGEAGVLHYTGGVQGIPATSIETTRARKLDVRSSSSRAYESYLSDRRDAHVAAIEQMLRHAVAVSHRYAITMNGIAVTLTPDEATRVARVPGVASVRASRAYALQTYRGPEFIGSDSIWNGAAAPGGLGTRGAGVVVGDVDSGIASAHPSFANDPSCGLDASHPKLLSAVDCTTTDDAGRCNGPDPEADPGNGHGVHTASTAVGDVVDGSANPPPTLPPPHTFISGVAPCAQLRTYKVCPISGCTDAALTAGIENAIADRVDAINFSIGTICGSVPGDSPWDDRDAIWLDALGADIFVAAAAGNTRPGCNDPGGRVSNIGPWMTTVAASTHDENVSGAGSMSATGPGTPPPDTLNVVLTPGTGLDVGSPVSNVPIRYYAANPIGCTVNGAFPPGYFDGAVALIERGNCTYEEKIDNAQAADAELAVVYNDEDGNIVMGVGDATLPAYSTTLDVGQAYLGYIDASTPTAVTVDFTPATRQADVLAAFSLRGPDVVGSLTKPDLTAPGVNIYAALDSAENNYGYLSGTSMSTPHVTGSGALLRALHADWTPSETKSALMLTAFTGGTREDLVSPWTPDDVGAGRVDLTKAALAGFVLDESYANYVAADPAHGGDPRTLNLASMRDFGGCDAPSPCTWTRSLRDALPGPSSWNVSVAAPVGVSVDVEPSAFAFAGTGATLDTIFDAGFDTADAQSISVTATTDPSLSGSQFAELVFHEANGVAPDAHMYVAMKGTAGGDGVGVVCYEGNCAFQVDVLTTTLTAVGCTTYCGVLWLNRYTPDPADYPITLDSISVVFGDQTGWNAPGDHINFYIYQDDDADPSNGANLVGSYQGYAIAAQSNDFTVVTLPVPIVVNGPGDIIIALTNPGLNVGTRPATADVGPFQARSWVAVYDDDGTPPDLAMTGIQLNPTALGGFPGNYLIRASGTNAAGRPIALGLPALQ